MNTEVKSSNQLLLLQKWGQYATILWCISIGWSSAMANSMMVITSILVLMNLSFQPQKINFKKIFTHPIILLFFIIFLSVFWSKDFISGLDNTKSYLPFLLFPLVLIYWNKVQPQVILKGVKYLSFSLVIGLIFTYLLNILPSETSFNLLQKFGHLFKPFTNSNKSLFGWYVPIMERIHFANILTYCGIASIFLFLKNKKVTYLLIGLFFVTSPFILGARASMIGVISFLPILFIYAINQYSKKLQPIVLIIGLILISIFAYISYPNILSRYHQTQYELESLKNQSFKEKDYQHFATLTRFVSWKHSWKLFIEKPAFGHGIGTYLDQYEYNYQLENNDLPMTYHSQWLYFLGVFGIIGLFIVLCSCIYFGFQLKTTFSTIYFCCFSIYVSVIWLFDTGLLQKKEMMAFVLFLSFAKCLEKADISFT